MAKFSALTDDFSTVTGLWNNATIVSGQLDLTIAANAGQYTYVTTQSLAAYDIKDSSIYFKVNWPTNVSTNPFISVGIETGSAPGIAFSFYRDSGAYSGGFLKVQSIGDDPVPDQYNGFAYNSNTMAYLRIREAAGKVYFETSADAATWAPFADFTHGATDAQLASLKVVIKHGTDTATNPNTVSLKVDNINTTGGAVAPPAPTAVSETWTGADGSAWPSKWSTLRVSNSQVTSNIKIVGNRGRMDMASFSNYTGLGAYFDTSTAEQDVTVESYNFNSDSEHFRGVWLRAGNGFYTNEVVPVTGVYFEFWPSWNGSGYSWYCLIRNRLNGVSTDLTSFDTGIPSSTKDFKIRVKVSGTTAQIKAWALNAIEPTAWASTQTVTVTTAGAVGLIAVTGSPALAGNYMDWDNLTLNGGGVTLVDAGTDQTVAANSVVTLTGTPAGGVWTQDSGTSVAFSTPVSTATDTKVTFVSTNASTTTNDTKIFRYTVEDGLLKYESFSNNIGAWVSAGDATTSTVMYSTEMGYSGAAGSLKMVSKAGAGITQSKAATTYNVPVVNGGTYRLRGWVRTVGAARQFAFTGNVNAADGGYRTFTGGAAQTIPADTWTFYDQNFTITGVTDAANFVPIIVTANLTTTGGETWYVADFRMSRV